MNAPAEKRDLPLSRFRLAGWIVTPLTVPLILLPGAGSGDAAWMSDRVVSAATIDLSAHARYEASHERQTVQNRL